MTVPRSRHQQKKYDHYRKTADESVCVFCDVNNTEDRFIEETSHFVILKNEFPYSLWDNQDVKDHLMITPKKHVSNLSSLSDKEKIEYMNLVEKYESKGYNLYARSPYSKVKTIPHQHTHLIKPSDTIRTFIFSIPKPYIRIAK